MDKNILTIAKRIKDLRVLSDISEAEIADGLQIAQAEYLNYENGKNQIPIGIIYNIAAIFKIDPTYLLTGDSEEKSAPFPVYEGEGTEVTRYPGYKFTSLAAGFSGRMIEPMTVELAAGVEPELVHHSGQEFNYVLEGKLRVLVGSKEFYLRQGESIYFDSSVPHAQVAMENKPAKFLTVILEK